MDTVSGRPCASRSVNSYIPRCVKRERNNRVPEVHHQGELDVPSIKKEKFTLGVLIC
jgi:hypothetical protein